MLKSWKYSKVEQDFTTVHITSPFGGVVSDDYLDLMSVLHNVKLALAMMKIAESMTLMRTMLTMMWNIQLTNWTKWVVRQVKHFPKQYWISIWLSLYILISVSSAASDPGETKKTRMCKDRKKSAKEIEPDVNVRKTRKLGSVPKRKLPFLYWSTTRFRIHNRNSKGLRVKDKFIFARARAVKEEMVAEYSSIDRRSEADHEYFQ